MKPCSTRLVTLDVVPLSSQRSILKPWPKSRAPTGQPTSDLPVCDWLAKPCVHASNLAAHEGRQLPSAISETLVATAHGDRDDPALAARSLKDAHAALGQILNWIDAFPFDVHEVAHMAAAASRRQ